MVHGFIVLGQKTAEILEEMLNGGLMIHTGPYVTRTMRNNPLAPALLRTETRGEQNIASVSSNYLASLENITYQYTGESIPSTLTQERTWADRWAIFGSIELSKASSFDYKLSFSNYGGRPVLEINGYSVQEVLKSMKSEFGDPTEILRHPEFKLLKHSPKNGTIISG